MLCTRYLSPFLNSFNQFSNGILSLKQETVKCPALGDSLPEGQLESWLKKEGESVQEDEVVAQVATDKVTVDIRSPFSGTVMKILVPSGRNIRVGQPLFELDDSKAASASASAPAAEKPAPKPEEKVEPKPVKKETVSAPKPQQVQAPKSEKPKVPTPVAPKSEKPKEIVIPQPNNFVELKHMTTENQENRVPLSKMRQRIAERLKNAQSTYAMCTVFDILDMTNIQNFRNKYKTRFEKQFGCKLGFMSVFMKASAIALMEFPLLNAVLDNEDIVYRNYVDISFAAATPKGLVVPVVRNLESKSLGQVEQEVGALTEKARNNEITLEDMMGGSFTVSNGGIFGGLFGTPIINPPQTAVLGMYSMKKNPVWDENSKSIQVHDTMYLALTFDHRIVDHREAILFLNKVKELVQDPDSFLLSGQI